jgi:hypothetical protein
MAFWLELQLPLKPTPYLFAPDYSGHPIPITFHI